MERTGEGNEGTENGKEERCSTEQTFLYSSEFSNHANVLYSKEKKKKKAKNQEWQKPTAE